MPADVVSLPPRGRYLAREVGQLAGVSGNTIGQWAHFGYINASQSAPGEYPRIYSFQDAAEAIIIHELLERQVPLDVLRPIIEGLRRQYGDWPLQRSRLETVGAGEVPVSALLVRHGDLRVELGDHGWQVVEHMTINPSEVATTLANGGWAARQLPELRHIAVDPDLLSGRPAIRGHRVPVQLVAELVTEQDGQEILREDYELSDEEIADAVRWWNASTAYEQAAA